MYIFLAIASSFCLACYNVLKKVSLKYSSVYETLFFYCSFGFLFALMFTNVNFINVDFIDILFILLKSCILAVNWLLVLIATKKLDVGVSTSFSMLNSIFIMIESAILFNEKITWIHITSFLIMALGIFLITRLSEKDYKEEKKNHYKYIALLIAGAILSSFSAIIDKYLIGFRGVEGKNLLAWYLLFNAIIYGVIYFIREKKINVKKLKSNYFPILVGLAICLSDTLYFASIAQVDAQLSLISILRKLNVIIATILASLFLKEKHLLKKLGILFVMSIGVALPILF